MQFNPSSKENSIVGDIDFLLFGNSATLNSDYSIADRTRNVNIALDEVVAELFKADPNFMWDDITNSAFPLAPTNLESGTDQYTLPDSSLVVHRVRIKDRNGKFVTLTPKLRRELTDSELEATGTPAKYFKIDNGIFPLPIPDYSVEGGVELEFQRGGNHFTTADTTKEPGFNSQFHQFLSICAAYRYAIANGMDKKAATLGGQKEAIKAAIREHYERRSPDERPKLRLKKPSMRSYGL